MTTTLVRTRTSAWTRCARGSRRCAFPMTPVKSASAMMMENVNSWPYRTIPTAAGSTAFSSARPLNCSLVANPNPGTWISARRSRMSALIFRGCAPLICFARSAAQASGRCVCPAATGPATGSWARTSAIAPWIARTKSRTSVTRMLRSARPALSVSMACARTFRAAPPARPAINQ